MLRKYMYQFYIYNCISISNFENVSATFLKNIEFQEILLKFRYLFNNKYILFCKVYFMGKQSGHKNLQSVMK